MPRCGIIFAGSAATCATGAVDDSGVGGVTSAQIRAAVASLDSENTEHFTQAGKPRVAAVVAALGAEVTGKQIEAALAEGEDDA